LGEVGPKFVVDVNAGKLVKWLRMMGFDTVAFDEPDDGGMVKIALAEDRIIITKDSEFMKRRSISSGRAKAILVSGDSSENQMMTVMHALKLAGMERPFTLCLECNSELKEMDRKEAEQLVPPRVSEVQTQYMACPACHRIYWRGTHWQAMNDKLHEFDAARFEETGGKAK
jgi:uncharacterized protein with PIN domain